MGCTGSGAVGPEALIPITILGLPYVGKTSIVEVLAGDYNDHDPPIPTRGVLQRQVHVHDHSFIFYDVCGDWSHQNEWVVCLEKSVAALIVFDPQVIDTAKIHIVSLYDRIGPALVERRIPTLVLVNRYEDGVDLTQIQQLNAEKLKGIPIRVATIVHLQQDVPREFSWLEELIT
jgi:hypothetical protein